MTGQISFSKTKLDRAMNPEQFNQVVEAILDGKYSWACVLILRFAGYNPLHYIPYRTYNRLLKENCLGSQSRHQIDNVSTETKRFEARSNGISSQKCLSEFTDLNYLEVTGEEDSQIRGGKLDGLEQELDGKIREYNLLRMLHFTSSSG